MVREQARESVPHEKMREETCLLEDSARLLPEISITDVGPEPHNRPVAGISHVNVWLRKSG